MKGKKVKLFILGNGLDLNHKLPTNYHPDFYDAAQRKGAIDFFRKCFDVENIDLWNNFEKSLSECDFDLGEI